MAQAVVAALVEQDLCSHPADSRVLLLSIASSKLSARLGVPALKLFLSVGMLAGSEGLGRIPFEHYGLPNSIGSIALALSTLGVLLTSLITGLAAAWVLQLPERLTSTPEMESGWNDPMEGDLPHAGSDRRDHRHG
jgi:NhaP-type Na+/H+ and K+/H+ antiporter